MKSRGFTLIELCVLITIVAILAAIVTPLGTSRYKDVCVGGVTYIEDTSCRQCSLTPKIDAETLQPQRCAVEKP